jgi:ribulose-phosphate 3-epimerase
MPTPLLSASILSANFRFLENEIRTAEQAGVDWIHIDVMDGQFVPNISMGPFIVEFCREVTSLPIDTHLMIEHPERHIRSFASAGTDYLTIHPESNPNVLRTLQEIRELGCKAGLALNPGSPAIMASPMVNFLDLILVMTVNPGYSGQAFIPQMKEKISEIKELAAGKKSPALVQVDGGINASNIAEVSAAGADVIVSASAIFSYPDGIAAGVNALQNALA